MDFTNSNTDASMITEPKPSLLCLPNEILAEIFENLRSGKDRANFGSMNNRLGAIEKITGCRDFSTVCYSTIEQPEIIAWDTSANKFKKTPSDDGLDAFFRRSTCRSLVIEGSLTKNDEDSILTAFKSLDFKQLKAEFKGDYAGSFLIDLLKHRNDIEELHIGGQRWTVGEEVDEARRMLMTIPATRRLTVASSSSDLLNDDVICHLVSVSHHSDLSGVKETSITTNGLAKVFETIAQSPIYKQVTCSVAPSALHQFLQQKQSQFSVVFGTNLEHVETETRFDYRTDKYDPEGFVHVSIRSSKRPNAF